MRWGRRFHFHRMILVFSTDTLEEYLSLLFLVSFDRHLFRYYNRSFDTAIALSSSSFFHEKKEETTDKQKCRVFLSSSMEMPELQSQDKKGYICRKHTHSCLFAQHILRQNRQNTGSSHAFIHDSHVWKSQYKIGSQDEHSKEQKPLSCL